MSGPRDRVAWLHRARTLAFVTVAWNLIEGVIALAAGLEAESVALLGFGFDSVIEMTSGTVVLWRVQHELSGVSAESAERAEGRAARVAGTLLLVLAAYLVFDGVRHLLGFGGRPETSVVGIALTAVSLVVMPLLGRAKLRAAQALRSRALRADATETLTCSWLSLFTVVGLLLNALLGWWWADPLAALFLVPWIAREGLEGIRGELHCAHD